MYITIFLNITLEQASIMLKPLMCTWLVNLIFCFKGVVEISFVDDTLVVMEGDSPLLVCTKIILPSGKGLGFNITVPLNASSGINAGI